MQKASIPQSPAAPGQTGTDTGAYTEKDIAGLKVIMAQKLTEHGVESKTAQRLAPVIVASRTGSQVSAQQAELLKAMESDSNIQAAVNEVFSNKGQQAINQSPTATAPFTQGSLSERQQTGTENTAQADGVKYSIMRTKYMSWADQIDGALSHKKQIKHSDTLVLDDTPGALVNDGVEGKKLAIPLSVITKAKSGKDASHSITDQNLKDLQRGVRNAPIVINNPARNALVFVTDIQQDGAPVLAAFQKNAQFDGDDVHKATSIHLQQNVGAMLKALPADATIYAKNESELDAAVGITDSLRSISAIIKFTGDTITQPMPGVNGEVVADEVESAEGKVLRGNTAVQISGVVDSDSGKLQVKLTDGSTADVSELSFPDTGEAELWRVVTEYAGTAEAAQTILQEYHNSDLDASRFARGVEEGILFGSVNMSPKEMNRRGNYVYMLSKAQRDMVYQIGQARGELQTQKREQAVRVGRRMDNPSVGSGDSSLYTREPSKVRRTGGVHYGYEGQQVDKSRLKDTQKVGVDFAERLSKKKGMTFYFFESEEQNGVRVFKNARGETVELKENGWYDPSDGSIHIDLNCGDMGSTVLYTIAHELTHFIKDMSPAKYRTLCSVVTEGYLDHGQSVQELVKNKQKEYAALGEELTWEEAYDEVIASSMEGIISDGEVMDLLDEIETRDKSLYEQIVSFLQEVAALIRDTIQAYRNVKPESPEGRMVMRMKGIHAQLQQVFAEALHDAGENFREGGKLNTANQGGVRMQLRKVNGDNVVWIERNLLKENLNKNPTHQFIANYIAQHIGEVYTIIESGQKVYIGTDLPGEYTQSEYTKAVLKNNPNVVKVKNRAATGVGEMIEIATNRRWERTKHAHNKDAKYGIYRYSTKFGFPVMDNKGIVVGANVFSAELLIRNASDGKKYLYDIVRIRKDTASSNWLTNKVASAAGVPAGQKGNVSNNNISPQSPAVNKNSSAKSPKSLRYQKNQAAQAHVAQQNNSLEEDVRALNQLTAEQRKRGNAGQLQRSTLDAAASFLMKTAGAKGDKSQLMKILDSFYTYVGTTENTHWEDVREQALPVVRWLIDNTVRTQQRSEYAQDILNYLRGCRIRLDEQQKKEVAHLYGTFGGYRNMLMGSITIANEGMSLDSQWHELSTLYPDVFDEEMTASDMPEALLDIVHRLRNEDTSALEYEYNREFIEQDLLQRVYDSYWNASTLYSVADHYEARIKELKGKHKQRMNAVYQRHYAAETNQKLAYQQKLKEAQSYYEERYQRREAEYKESRQKAVERHDQAQVRQQIRKDVEKLDGILNRGNKEKNVKLELKEFAGAALRVAKG